MAVQTTDEGVAEIGLGRAEVGQYVTHLVLPFDLELRRRENSIEGDRDFVTRVRIDRTKHPCQLTQDRRADEQRLTSVGGRLDKQRGLGELRLVRRSRVLLDYL